MGPPAAIADGALDVRLPKHAKKELDAYLDCGLPKAPQGGPGLCCFRALQYQGRMERRP
jgi:hypothetical protein